MYCTYNTKKETIKTIFTTKICSNYCFFRGPRCLLRTIIKPLHEQSSNYTNAMFYSGVKMRMEDAAARATVTTLVWVELAPAFTSYCWHGVTCTWQVVRNTHTKHQTSLLQTIFMIVDALSISHLFYIETKILILYDQRLVKISLITLFTLQHTLPKYFDSEFSLVEK